MTLPYQPNTAGEGTRIGNWMALTAALLGWLFDGFEIGMFPLVGPNALKELLQKQMSADPNIVTKYFGVIMATFLIGAATGGVFFGWLGDRVGRVRAMSLSIFTYAIFTGLCGFATEAWHIAVLRFIASLGMGGEWALGVALVSELWPDKSRALLSGLIGAAANVGILLVGLLSLVLVNFINGYASLLTKIGMPAGAIASLLSGEGWRLLMIAGAIPALLIFFIRLFVPESHKWEAQRDQGATDHWATRDLFGVLIGACGSLAVIFLWSPLFEGMLRMIHGGSAGVVEIPDGWRAARLFGTAVGLIVALLGYIYPIWQYLRRAEAAGQLSPESRSENMRRMLLGACLAGVALLGTWGSLQWAPKWAAALAQLLPPEGGPYHAKEYVQIFSALGAIVGTILAALMGGWLGRRITYVILCVGSFVSLVYLYRANDVYGAKLLASVFVAGGITAAFYGWFPLYLPELFPTRTRATSQGFAYNFGRVLSAIGSLQTATLTAYFAAHIAQDQTDTIAFPKAGATLATIYLLGVFIIWFGPETKGKSLPA